MSMDDPQTPFQEKLERSEEYKILHNLVHYPEARVEGYVNQIIAQCHIGMAIHDQEPEHGVGLVDTNLFISLMELAQCLEPSKNGKLVQMVVELEKRVLLHPGTGEVLAFQGDKFFTDLPALGWSELEAWDERGGSWHDVTDPDMDAEQKNRWVNLNGFVARLSQAAELREPFNDPLSVHKLDRSLRAIWVMSAALENGTRYLEELVETAAVRAACMWFIYASDRLLQKVDLGVRYPDNYGAGPGDRFSEKDWKGHELERWIVWMQTLQQLRAVCVNDETESLIDAALRRAQEALAENTPSELEVSRNAEGVAILTDVLRRWQIKWPR